MSNFGWIFKTAQMIKRVDRLEEMRVKRELKKRKKENESKQDSE